MPREKLPDAIRRDVVDAAGALWIHGVEVEDGAREVAFVRLRRLKLAYGVLGVGIAVR
jgi:hypothetical protein